MDKEQLKRIVERYLDGRATAKEQKILEAWIVLAEKQNRSLTDEEKKVIEKRLWDRISPNARAEFSVENKRGVLRMSRHMLRYAAIWIGVAAVCTSAYLFRYPLLDIVNPIAVHTEKTGPYDVRKITLPDSSVITLGVNSVLSYPEKYRGEKRYATLKGKAFFSVTHNEALPFIVESGDMKVRVLGTSFEVESEEDKNDAEVTVVTGKVRVSVNDQAIALLTRNQKVTYHKKEMLADVNKNINAADLTNWTKNQFVFNETSLATALQTVANVYGITIQTSEARLKTTETFSGSFVYGERWADVLDVICMSSGLKWSLTANKIVVVKKAS
ncbi:MAG: FecR domain-containing protein [Filimonas sp.]|nr:FecR domain-containing protein [Filimonas sp.]